MGGDLTIDIDVNHEGSGITTSGGDFACSGSGDVTIKSNHYGVAISGNVIFSGSGAVSITDGYYAVLLDDRNGKVLLNGSENPISLKSTEGDCEAVINSFTEGSPVEGTSLGDYDVTGAPNESSVVYTKKPEYTVSFNMNGHDDQITAQTVKEGETAGRPADPSASRRTFNGWYADTAFSTPFDFDTAINADITIYAKWSKNSVTPDDPTNPAVPKTGDNSRVFLWAALMLISGGALAGTIVYGKKKRAE